MCRAEAQEFWTEADKMKAAGASRVVAIVKEDVGTEVADFRAEYWGGEVLMNSGKEFYTALGGGTPHNPTGGTMGFLALLANPFSKSRTKAHLKRDKAVKANLTGEGYVSGGCYVIAASGEPTFSFLEEELGDRVPVQDVIAGLQAATGK